MWKSSMNPLLTLVDKELKKYSRYIFSVTESTHSGKHVSLDQLLCGYHAARDAYDYAKNSLNWKLIKV